MKKLVALVALVAGATILVPAVSANAATPTSAALCTYHYNWKASTSTNPQYTAAEWTNSCGLQMQVRTLCENRVTSVYYWAKYSGIVSGTYIWDKSKCGASAAGPDYAGEGEIHVRSVGGSWSPWKVFWSN